MTVYVTGDIHGGVDMQKLRDWDLGDGLTSDDYLIIAGDFGFPWDFSAEECADIAWLECAPIRCCLSTETTSVSITGRSAPWSCGTAA